MVSSKNFKYKKWAEKINPPQHLTKNLIIVVILETGVINQEVNRSCNYQIIRNTDSKTERPLFC